MCTELSTIYSVFPVRLWLILLWLILSLSLSLSLLAAVQLSAGVTGEA